MVLPIVSVHYFHFPRLEFSIIFPYTLTLNLDRIYSIPICLLHGLGVSSGSGGGENVTLLPEFLLILVKSVLPQAMGSSFLLWPQFKSTSLEMLVALSWLEIETREVTQSLRMTQIKY